MNIVQDRLAVPTEATALPHRSTEATPTAQLIELVELSEHRAGDGPAVLEEANPLHGIKTRVQVCVGEAEISLGELLAAREHHVLKLDRGVNQPVDLMLSGKVIARGQLVAIDDHFAVRITELPTPLTA